LEFPLEGHLYVFELPPTAQDRRKNLLDPVYLAKEELAREGGSLPHGLFALPLLAMYNQSSEERIKK
jgi:hypothetical protein